MLKNKKVYILSLLVFFFVNMANSQSPTSIKTENKTKVMMQKEDNKKAVPADMAKVEKSNSEWKASLTPIQFHVLREKGTERPYTGELYKNTSEGIYSCAGCGQELFKSDTKFESGCGWPSFFAPLLENNTSIKMDRSFGMIREEVLCSKCGGHLGHVFNDGPPPTGRRYCINSASLVFTPASEQK